MLANSNVKSRLLRGMAATAMGPVLTSLIQLGSVPLLLRAWGASKYGDWLLLSAVPSYLSFSSLGFGDSSGSDMTMRVASRDLNGALQTFQSSWVLLTAISASVLAAVLAIVWWVSWHDALHLSGVSNKQASLVLLALAGWVLVGQQSNVLESGYRCDGNFALGNLLSNLQRFLEVVIGTIIGITTGSLLLVACCYLCARFTGVLAYGWLLRRKSPWLKLGFRHANLATIRRMLKPSFAFIAMPIGNAVSIQGFTILVGVVLGPVAVSAFSTARTLTRVGIQLINAVCNGIWPEFSAAFGSGNISLARSLHRHAYQASLILSVACATGLWLLGPRFYEWWVGRSVALDYGCFHVLLLVTIANSLWYASATVQMSTNTHSRLALLYLSATILACGIGYPLTRLLGVRGAAVALLLVDITMCTFVLRRSLRQMDDTPRGFFGAVFGSAPFFMRPLLAGLSLRR